MKNNKQSVNGDNNVVIGSVIHTPKYVSKVEIAYDKEQHITPAQQLKLREKITELGKCLDAGKSNGSGYKQAYRKLYRQFNIPKYELLPREQFDEAMNWLTRQIASIGMRQLKSHNPDEWKKRRYTSIYAKSQELGINKEELYVIINNILGHQRTYQSLTELSSRSLNIVYEWLFRHK